MKLKRIPKPTQWFSEDSFSKPADFDESGCIYCEPMLAKEITKDTEQDRCFKSSAFYVEEKFDGTRGILQFFDKNILELNDDCVPDTQRGFTRCFSRRISKKTNWFCENTDSVPHLRDIDVPELAGTIIDGEMFIDGRPFKDVAAALNCSWDKAVDRQRVLGKITFHAFDILRYKNINTEKMPLYKRKEYLQRVVDKVHSPNLIMVKYYQEDGIEIHLYGKDYKKLSHNKEEYSELWKQVQKQMPLHEKGLKDSCWAKYKVSKRAYYEFIILTGGEGVILKPIDGKYYPGKRGNEYLKVKKFLTREVIVTGFIDPTVEYNGGLPRDAWPYWVNQKHVRMSIEKMQNMSAKELKAEGYIPVTKFFYYDQIGELEYGVILDDPKALPVDKQFIVKKLTLSNGNTYDIVVVGECGGITDEEREYISNHQADTIGKVIEVKANELFKDTGKLRHPRFLRFREDKNIEECTWENHVGVSV